MKWVIYLLSNIIYLVVVAVPCEVECHFRRLGMGHAPKICELAFIISIVINDLYVTYDLRVITTSQ